MISVFEIATSEQRLATDAALARSVLYGALAIGFRPPSEQSRQRLTSPEAADALRAAAALLDSNGSGSTSVLPALRDWLGVLRRSPIVDLAGQYQRLFGHTARGVVCPFETEYGIDGVFQQSQVLADIAGSYLAFGLRPGWRTGERVDHVGCECEFMDFLCRKEALGIELCREADHPCLDARRETLEETRKAARGFLKEHLGRFGRAVATRLMAEDPDGSFGGLGAVLRDLLRADCARLAVPPGPETLDLRATALDDVPMMCGSGEELIQIQRNVERRT